MRKLTLNDLPKKHLVKLCEAMKVKFSQQEIAIAIYAERATRYKASEKAIEADLQAIKKIRGKRRREAATRRLSIRVDRHNAFADSMVKFYENYDLANLPERSNDGD